MGTAILVTSGKGGTGKTTVTAGVAACLAALGRRVLCVDLDIGLRKLDLVLGLTDRAAMDFSDVMAFRCPLSAAAVEHPDIKGLFLLTAPVRLEDPDPEGFRRLIADAKDSFEYVLMDSPAGLGAGFQLGMTAADQAIVVSATDPSALRDAQRVVTELLSCVKDIRLVMNRVQPKLIRRLRTTIDSAMDEAGLPLLGIVPEDGEIAVAAACGEPLALYSHGDAAMACLNITRRLLGRHVPLLRIR